MKFGAAYINQGMQLRTISSSIAKQRVIMAVVLLHYIKSNFFKRVSEASSASSFYGM
jgi:hypothetical protein